jgi:hypothetical protein
MTATTASEIVMKAKKAIAVKRIAVRARMIAARREVTPDHLL